MVLRSPDEKRYGILISNINGIWVPERPVLNRSDSGVVVCREFERRCMRLKVSRGFRV